MAADAWNRRQAGGASSKGGKDRSRGGPKGGKGGRGGRGGRGGDGGGKDGGGRENEAKPPEVETQNNVDKAVAKPKPKPKGKKLTTAGSENWGVIDEELFSFVEQIAYRGSSVQRVPGTMELKDFFLTIHETRGEAETEAELC